MFAKFKRAFKPGVPASDCIKSLVINLDALVDHADGDPELLAVIQNKIGDDFAQLVQCSIDAEDNKKKLVGKFLKCEDAIPQNTLIFRVLDHCDLFPGDAQLNMEKIIKFIVSLSRNKANESFHNWGSHKGLHLVDKVIENVFAGGDEHYMRSMSCILYEMLQTEEYLDYILHLENCISLCHIQIESCKNNEFVIMNDAFNTLELLLTGDCAKGCVFLSQHYDDFFVKYNAMLFDKDAIYASKRRGFKLLCDILESKEFKSVMMRYISDKANLKRVLIILDGKKQEANSVRFEAFHVFKLFLGNPRKVPDIYRVIYRNKEKLKTFLEDFQKEKEKDAKHANFAHAKVILIKKLGEMVWDPEDYDANYEQKRAQKMEQMKLKQQLESGDKTKPIARPKPEASEASTFIIDTPSPRVTHSPPATNSEPPISEGNTNSTN